MTKPEFSKQMKKLESAYFKKFSDGDLDTWWYFFKDYDNNKFIEAIDEVIETSQYMPNIAILKEKLKPDILKKWGVK